MTASAPRLSPRLIDALERFDDGKLPIAELRRRVSAEAERLGLARPSYESVRTHARAVRARRAEISTLDVLVDITTRRRAPEELLEHLSGVGVRPLPK